MSRGLFPCSALLLAIVLPAATAAASDERGLAAAEPQALALYEAARAALASEATAARPADEDAGRRMPVLDGTDLPRPSIIVVGFTGGLERHDSAVSGVVRLRNAVRARLGGTPDVAMLTYNNFDWRQAGRDVLHLVRFSRDRAARLESPSAPPSRHVHARDDARRVVPDVRVGSPSRARPIIVVYGHSWGAGSIAKLARVLAEDDLEVTLAMYIDAVTMRNPRVPANVRHAVNFYQRTGLLRGLPLRGKRHLVPEAPERTTAIGSFRIRPETTHFGWHWNLVQPLLYRHHHRISHDVRLQHYLLEVVVLHLQLLAGDHEPMPAREIPAAPGIS